MGKAEGQQVPDELLPRPELAPPALAHLTPAECVQLWLELMGTCDALLRAGLEREQEGDPQRVVEAYRRWYDRVRLDHEAVIRRMARRLQEARDAS